MTEFAFLRLCFSHCVSLFRALHLNVFIAFCGSIDTTSDKEISDVVSAEIFAEEKHVGP